MIDMRSLANNSRVLGVLRRLSLNAIEAACDGSRTRVGVQRNGLGDQLGDLRLGRLPRQRCGGRRVRAPHRAAALPHSRAHQRLGTGQGLSMRRIQSTSYHAP